MDNGPDTGFGNGGGGASLNEAPLKATPANMEAEKAVLGSLLIDPDAIIKIANFLRAEDFFRERHTWI
jgi:replicative DNA helicase